MSLHVLHTHYLRKYIYIYIYIYSDEGRVIVFVLRGKLENLKLILIRLFVFILKCSRPLQHISRVFSNKYFYIIHERAWPSG